MSPSNSLSDIQEEVLDYLDAGTDAVWIVDPGARTLTVHRSRSEIRILGADDVVDGEDVLPGFRMRVGELIGG